MKMVKTHKLKDGTYIQEQDKGVFAIIFPNKRYLLCTTWEGKVKVDAPGYGQFEMGTVTEADFKRDCPSIVQAVKEA
jgi:hypothetical protein